ncbi:MAG TPA: PAS domain S-box protein [Bryobacteraceae bacterium]|nr:PAS domain S-box protein [Bryobacteraceae bacterium]
MSLIQNPVASPSDALAEPSDSLRLLDQGTLEEKLRESERHFQSWFEDAPIACHEVDRNGVIVCVNQAECAIFGFRAEDMVGHYIWDFMTPEDREKTKAGILERIVDEQPLVPLEREYKRHDGGIVIMEIHQKRVRDAAGRPVGLRTFLLDITARKHAEQTLQEQAEKLARSNAELEQFAYIASHDLQEPLRKIQAFGDRLKKKYESALGPEGIDYLVRMQNAAARMQTLIQDLLSLSRVTSQAKPFTVVDLNEVVQTVVSDLEYRIERTGGRVDVSALPLIFGDRGQMAQLLQNLIGNALKFQKPGEPPVVKVSSEFLTQQNGGANVWQVVVEDNGIGFDEKYRERIFQIFQRLHGRSEYEGTGIGLAICRKIVDRHSGNITAYSTPGSGAKFVITLPHTLLQGEPK